MNEKHSILCFWILTNWAYNCNNSSNFWIFSEFQVEVERKVVKLHSFSLSQIPKMVILKVRIKVDQDTSTLGMHRPLGVNCTFVTHFCQWLWFSMVSLVYNIIKNWFST